uniref:Uncharacterized protein n=1 Tax=Morchella importuna TaxID=1174673 RepID=A0A650AF51_9PEZI|nr:hypothetical protein [Morchella importuna]QGN66650.1 hypothetical protein [Morchella importuna]
MAFQWLHDNNGVACRAGSRTFGSSQGALPPPHHHHHPRRWGGGKRVTLTPQNWTKHKIPCPLGKKIPLHAGCLCLWGRQKKKTLHAAWPPAGSGKGHAYPKDVQPNGSLALPSVGTQKRVLFATRSVGYRIFIDRAS